MDHVYSVAPAVLSRNQIPALTATPPAPPATAQHLPTAQLALHRSIYTTTHASTHVQLKPLQTKMLAHPAILLVRSVLEVEITNVLHAQATYCF